MLATTSPRKGRILSKFISLFSLPQCPHHLLLRDQMIDSLEYTQQGFHIPTPLVQYIIRLSWFREADDARGTIDAGIDRLGGDQFTQIFLCFRGIETEEVCKSWETDAGVIFRDDPDVMLDDAFAEIEPALMTLRGVVNEDSR